MSRKPLFENERTIMWRRFPNEAPAVVSVRCREMVIIWASIPVTKEPKVGVINSLRHAKYLTRMPQSRLFKAVGQ